MAGRALDAVVVGSGPNGLAAAVTLAAAGLSVCVLEGAASPGGGARSAELTLPGFTHDVCSAVHPLAVASPFFRAFGSERHGVRFATPEVAFAHPLGGGRAAALHGSVADTAAGLDAPDRHTYRRLMAPVVAHADQITDYVLGPIRGLPGHPLTLARFAARSAWPTSLLLAGLFRGDLAPALLAGAAAHSIRPFSGLPPTAFGLLLTLLGHTTGWPVVCGGSQRLVDALVAALTGLGGELVTGQWVRRLRELPPARLVLLDVTPRQFLALAGDALPAGYAGALRRYRYGPGVCKVDYALSGPVPWAAEVCRRAGTVHVGGAWREVATSLAEVDAGRHPEHPFVLAAQPGVADPSRAPAGRHVLWTYCHVPNGSTVDMRERIDAQLERFAPGFRDLVLGRRVRTAAELEGYDPNAVGGDISGGAATVRQMLLRPVARWNPYATPLPGVYLCSSATPPGPGVHGMCGLLAARAALHQS